MTIGQIIAESTDHPVFEGGRIFKKEFGDRSLIVVGGSDKLYGNFKDTFEVHIVEGSKSVVQDYFPHHGSLIPYCNGKYVIDVYTMLESSLLV